MNNRSEGTAAGDTAASGSGARRRQDQQAPKGDELLAIGESRRVACVRFVVMFVLVSACTVLAVLTYRNVAASEGHELDYAYGEAWRQLSFGFRRGVDTMVATTASLAAVYTSRHGSPNDDWPFVTMPHFQEQAGGQLVVSGGRAIEFSPLVTEANRSLWEAYAVENAAVVGAQPEHLSANGIYMKDENGAVVRATGNYSSDGSPSRYRYRGLFSPVWQISPVESNEKAFLFDLRSQADRRRAVDDMIQFQVPTLTSILQLVQDGDDLRPSAILFSPVFSTFDRDRRKVVGSTLVVFNWDTLFRNLLPNNIRGMVVVMETNTGQQFTFAINGDDVKVLGEGDLHDRHYDRYHVSIEASLADSTMKDSTGPPQGVDEDGVIRYTFHVYPSRDFEAQYVSTAPAIYTVVVVTIFIVTSAAFILYDCLVKNHNSVIMRAAQRSKTMVDSMFPPTVRDRVFHQRRGSINRALSGRKRSGSTSSSQGLSTSRRRRSSFLSCLPDHVTMVVEKPALKMKRFLLPSGGKSDHSDMQQLESDPIADLFPSATVMFADIAGFTSWSSERDPAFVFHLLERVFKTFDDLATRMGVFKISTIGDCYLAVAGLPVSREDHAEVMASFAVECQRHFGLVASDLSRIPSLGWDTAELRLRCGVHSGPVTAGVLRGLRARFEVFGDTVNTASRMESTGVPEKVQVSQQTADLLLAAGRGDWLRPRDGLVVAKGKGSLQTYWLKSDNVAGVGCDRTQCVLADGCKPCAEAASASSIDQSCSTTSSLNLAEPTHEQEENVVPVADDNVMASGGAFPHTAVVATEPSIPSRIYRFSTHVSCRSSEFSTTATEEGGEQESYRPSPMFKDENDLPTPQCEIDHDILPDGEENSRDPEECNPISNAEQPRWYPPTFLSQNNQTADGVVENESDVPSSNTQETPDWAASTTLCAGDLSAVNANRPHKYSLHVLISDGVGGGEAEVASSPQDTGRLDIFHNASECATLPELNLGDSEHVPPPPKMPDLSVANLPLKVLGNSERNFLPDECDPSSNASKQTLNSHPTDAQKGKTLKDFDIISSTPTSTKSQVFSVDE